MAFAVGDIGKRGYEVGFIIFIYLCLASLAMAWIFKYIEPVADGTNSEEAARMDSAKIAEVRQ